MALQEDLNGKKVQSLIDDDTFINALVTKLITDGSPASRMYTKLEVESTFATKVALNSKANAADVYTKAVADAEFLKTSQLPTKVAEKAVVDAIFDAKDGNDNISETKIATTFAKRNELDNKVNLNGSNATDPGVTAMLDKLTNKVVKADGTNLDNDKVASILNKLTDKVVQTSQLATPDVVNAITASPDFTQKVYIKANPADEVYTKTDADTEFLKTSQLPTKVAEKAVVDLLVPALAAGSDDSGIYTKKSMDDELVKKADTTNVYAKAAADTAFVKTSELATPAVVDAITASPDFTQKVYIKANPADEVYTKTDADTEFLKTSQLPTKVAEKAVVDLLVPALAAGSDDSGIYTKKSMDDELVKKADTTNVYAKAAADTAFVKTSELATPAVVDAITASPNFTNKVYIKATPPDEVYTKTVANTTFAKVDGSNSTEASVNAMLGKLTGDNAVVKAPALTTKVNVDGSNATGLGVTAMLGTLTDTVVKTSELPTKVATQAVVNVLVPELAKGANDLGIYTKKGVDDALVSKFTNDATFKTQVIENTLRDPGFQNTVREVISQPVFDIPTDPSAPISVDW